MTQDELEEHKLAGLINAHGVKHVVKAQLIGSASYLPPEECSDVDFAVLIKAGDTAGDTTAMDVALDMASDGWDLCGDYDTKSGEWVAVRRGMVNLMITHSKDFYDGYLRATDVCALLMVRDKDTRIAICRLVRDGLPLEEAKGFLPTKDFT